MGDLLDRGEQNFECLSFVNSIDRKILIRGNHEDLLESLLNRGWISDIDIHNGTTTTLIECYKKVHSTTDLPEEAISLINDFKEYDIWKRYVNSLVDYYEDGDYIFVHGWIPLTISEDGKDLVVHQNWRDGGWKDARWLCGMRQWKENLFIDGKTIFCGHWHTSWGHSKINGCGEEWGPKAIFDPFVAKGIVAMDGCVPYSKKVNVARLDKNGLVFNNPSLEE